MASEENSKTVPPRPPLFERILSEEEKRPMEFLDCLTVVIQAKLCSAFLERSEKYELGLPHLRRVRSLGKEKGVVQVLVCKKDKQLKDEEWEELAASFVLFPLEELPPDSVLAPHRLPVYIVPVAAFSPVTQAQWRACEWPLRQRPTPRDYEKGPLFTAAEEEFHLGRLRDAAALARAAQVCGATVIVDRSSGETVASGVDERVTNPLRHSVMNAIEAVAQRETRLVESGTTGVPFLCTGFDLYTVVEPCVMCSMALNHSRIGRVFFSRACPAMGGLGSVLHVNSNPHMNHRYLAYLVAPEENLGHVCHGNHHGD